MTRKATPLFQYAIIKPRLASSTLSTLLLAGLVSIAMTTTANAVVMFNFNYLDTGTGAGFDDPTLGAARRQALEQTATAIGGLLNHTATLDIDVAISQSDGGGFVGLASTFSSQIAVGSQGFRYRNAAEKILNGNDRNGATADATITWDFGFNIHTDTTAPGFNQIDMRSVALHELTHLLDFATGINADGSGFNTTQPPGSPTLIYNTFDSFLVNGSSTPLIDPATIAFNTAASVSDLTTGMVFFDGTNARAANGGNPIELTTPDPFAPGTSLSHIDSSLNAVMNAAIITGVAQRQWSPLDVAILRDLGYSIIPEPNAAAVLIFVGTLIAARRRQPI